MIGTLTTEFLRGAFAQETGEVLVFLLTITHPDLADPIQVSSDPTGRLIETDEDVIYGTRSRGQDYYFFPFTLTLPEDGDDGPQAMTLSLDNVHRQITATLRTITGPATIAAEIVLASAPDTVQAVWPDYLLTHATIDATTVTGTLQLETLVEEPFPAGSFSPAYFPGLF